MRAKRGSDDKPEVRCRLVAQYFGYGKCLDDACVGPLSLTVVKPLQSVIVERDSDVVLLGVKRAFLLGEMWRSVYTEPPRQDLRYVWRRECDGEVEEGHVWGEGRAPDLGRAGET